MSNLEVVWSRGKDKDVIDLNRNKLNGGGVYVFVINQWPFYVGTAGERGFYKRLQAHKRYFKNGLRTYLLPEHFMKQIGQKWTNEIKKIEFQELKDYVYVPGTVNNPKVENQGERFWEQLEIFVGKIANPTQREIKGIELCLQRKFQNEAAKDEVPLPNIPGMKYSFFGKQENVPELRDASHNTFEIRDSILADLLNQTD